MQASENIAQVGPTHPVLVPVDFSECARSALIYAASLTSDTRTPLLLLHVVHDSADDPGFYRRSDIGNSLRPIADVADEMFEIWLISIRREHTELDPTLRRARRRLVEGLPGNRIVEVAEAEQAAMIIMGTNGRSGLSHLLCSSVTEYVMAHAGVPLTILREGIDTTRSVEHLRFTPLVTSAAAGDC
jgi:nucleotide-binding universal stress UspA family protein